jgi:trk system potassium uptake protein
MVKKFSSKDPGRLLLLTVILTIAFGTLLLALPISQNRPISFIDILFTTTSTTCVTGMLSIPLESFTLFGKFIIFLLMQIGGIGLVTMTLILMSFFIDIGLSTQLMASQILEIDKLKNIKKMFLFIFSLTAIVEILGAIIIFFIIRSNYDFYDAIFYSFFHSISSFCNAGMTLFRDGMAGYSQNLPMLSVTALLMLIGGLGFVVWHELFQFLKTKFSKKESFFNLSLHTKIILSFTGILIIFGSIIFFTLETNNTLIDQSLGQKIYNSIFNGISVRSTGFLTIGFPGLQLATILYIMIMSFIGSSPGSTGSGIKTTVFAIFLATVKSVLSGRKTVEIFGRKLAQSQVYKALTIITLSMTWIIVTSFFLLITEKSFSFLEIIFETTSAFVNLGISSGITAELSVIGKVFLVTTMIIGRIGSLTLALAFLRGPKKVDFSYPEEKVMLS